MASLRRKAIITPPAELGIQPTDEYPRVYGIVMDWPIGDAHTASIVSLSDGTASLYTTSTFGVIGGIRHESVRAAAQRFVRTAESYYEDAIPVSDYAYPAEDRVRFYLATFRGVRMIEGDLASISSGQDRYSDLFGLGQGVLTELRLIAEKEG